VLSSGDKRRKFTVLKRIVKNARADEKDDVGRFELVDDCLNKIFDFWQKVAIELSGLLWKVDAAKTTGSELSAGRYKYRRLVKRSFASLQEPDLHKMLV
jgi:hypothetical protein